jgi:hypothetical protein
MVLTITYLLGADVGNNKTNETYDRKTQSIDGLGKSLGRVGLCGKLEQQ